MLFMYFLKDGIIVQGSTNGRLTVNCPKSSISLAFFLLLKLLQGTWEWDFGLVYTCWRKWYSVCRKLRDWFHPWRYSLLLRSRPSLLFFFSRIIDILGVAYAFLLLSITELNVCIHWPMLLFFLKNPNWYLDSFFSLSLLIWTKRASDLPLRIFYMMSTLMLISLTGFCWLARSCCIKSSSIFSWAIVVWQIFYLRILWSSCKCTVINCSS